MATSNGQAPKVTRALEAAMTGPRSCGDCGATPGDEHADGCDVARCLVTGRQRLSCDVGTVVFGWPEKHPHDDCGQQARRGPGAARTTPRAGPDLNRLVVEAVWDPQACRWRRPADPVDDTAYVHWHLERGYALEPSARYTVDGVSLPAAELLARIAGRPS